MLNITPRRATVLGLALTAALGLSACESSPSGSAGAATGAGGGVENAKVAFLMPDLASTRYELQDKPLFEAKMKELCPTCTVIYQNADSDASKQQQQANSALAQGAKVLVIDPVDSAGVASTVQAAQSQGAKVIAYDRPSTKAKADFYVSFDNEKIGNLIATSLIDHLKKTNATGGVLQINGSPHRRRRRPDQEGRAQCRRPEWHQAARGVRHPELAAGQGPGVDHRPDHPLR